MSPSGNPSAQALTEAAEKCIAKMDDADLARVLQARYARVDSDDRVVLVEALFDAFRDRGESSDDVHEASGVILDPLVVDAAAFAAVVVYARGNSGVLKETFTLLVERQPASIGDLPL